MPNDRTVIAVIPARMGSSRYPGKPIAQILGMPMIEHVYRRVKMCKMLDAVYVATCDREIAAVAEKFGAPTVMTSDRHERASDRVAEVAESVRAGVYVLVQGDEPMTTPDMIDAAVQPILLEPKIDCVNLTTVIQSEEEFRDRNTIKVVMSAQGDALYFSREPIPHPGKLGFSAIPRWKQVCIIPFRRATLLKYADLAPTPLEKAESIDMMRFLEHGYRVRMVPIPAGTHAVDTPQDLKVVEGLMRNDPLTRSYLRGT
ncbi:MAG: 3-deoxy-manno-octulosonate cytidylyltransferase [Chloroflexi bacterium]|nr:3-deoxy-manno-octulosonate cytidylyltransferase [Chloroflexota bacterium]